MNDGVGDLALFLGAVLFAFCCGYSCAGDRIGPTDHVAIHLEVAPRILLCAREALAEAEVEP